jgi:hypothetical protein
MAGVFHIWKKKRSHCYLDNDVMIIIIIITVWQLYQAAA